MVTKTDITTADARKDLRSGIIGGISALISGVVITPLHELIHSFTAIAGGGSSKGIYLDKDLYGFLGPILSKTSGVIQLFGESDAAGISKVTVTNYMHGIITLLMPNFIISMYGLYFLRKGIRESDHGKLIYGGGLAISGLTSLFLGSDSARATRLIATGGTYSNAFTYSPTSQEALATYAFLTLSTLALSAGTAIGIGRLTERNRPDLVMRILDSELTAYGTPHTTQCETSLFCIESIKKITYAGHTLKHENDKLTWQQDKGDPKVVLSPKSILNRWRGGASVCAATYLEGTR